MYLQLLARARAWVDLEASSLDRAMERAAPYARGRLLDVGCGNKPYEQLFREWVSEYIGVEYDATYQGSDYATESKSGIVFYSGDRLPMPDASFDTVLSNQVAEHVPDPRAHIAELVRVLKPGGRLIMTVPFAHREHAQPHDFHRFTRFALAHYAEAFGLEVDLLEPRGGVWQVVGQKISAHLALRVARLGRDAQRVGAFGYEATKRERPRYWILPLAAPAIVAVTTAARVLDAVDHDDSDTLGFLLVATKR